MCTYGLYIQISMYSGYKAPLPPHRLVWLWRLRLNVHVLCGCAADVRLVRTLHNCRTLGPPDMVRTDPIAKDIGYVQQGRRTFL